MTHQSTETEIAGPSIANYAPLFAHKLLCRTLARSSSSTGNQHGVHNRLLDQPAGSRRVDWIEIAESDDRRSALV